MSSEPVHTHDRDTAPGSDDFYRSHSLEELLAGAEPLESISDLLIDELTDEEGDAFLTAVGALAVRSR